MNPKIIFPSEWEYFLALENDLVKCSRFVEFSQQNFKTYSIEFVRILLASASEFDVICKQICKLIDPETDTKNIMDYQVCIMSEYSYFAGIEIEIPRYNLSLKPFEAWYESKSSPVWWQASNLVKHERNNHFAKANLENTLLSVAGLLSGLLYLFHLRNKGFDPPPIYCAPSLLLPRRYSYFLESSISGWQCSLPSIECEPSDSMPVS